MKIILLSEDSIRLIPDAGPMTVEAPDPDQSYSPFHMLGSALATCTFSVLYSWATHAKLSVDDLTIDVSWTFAEDPYRVGRIEMTYDWPSLPENRVRAASRAAELCTIHTTLSHPPEILIAPGAKVGAGDDPPGASTAAARDSGDAPDPAALPPT